MLTPAYMLTASPNRDRSQLGKGVSHTQCRLSLTTDILQIHIKQHVSITNECYMYRNSPAHRSLLKVARCFKFNMFALSHH